MSLRGSIEKGHIGVLLSDIRRGDITDLCLSLIGRSTDIGCGNRGAPRGSARQRREDEMKRFLTLAVAVTALAGCAQSYQPVVDISRICSSAGSMPSR